MSPNAKVREYGNQCGLHTASTHGCLPAIHILVNAGAALDLTDSQLQTPLMIAIMKNHNDIVNYLIQAGANLNAKVLHILSFRDKRMNIRIDIFNDD